MLVRLVITLILVPFFAVIYLLAKNKRKEKILRWKKSLGFMEFNVSKMSSSDFSLAGNGSDNNSDFEVSKAIRMIQVPDDVRIQLYD